jgi:hypothetical protein
MPGWHRPNARNPALLRGFGLRIAQGRQERLLHDVSPIRAPSAEPVAGAAIAFLGALITGFIYSPLTTGDHSLGGSGVLDFVLGGRVFEASSVLTTGLLLVLVLVGAGVFVRLRDEDVGPDPGLPPLPLTDSSRRLRLLALHPRRSPDSNGAVEALTDSGGRTENPA